MDDEWLLKLREYYDLLALNSRYLLSFSPFFVNHISVSLISYIMENNRSKILYICVGRPHIFVQKMLQNKGVPTRDIFFMDMILSVSSRPGSTGGAEITFNEGRKKMKIPGVYKLFRVDQEIDRLSLDEIDLVIFDNISELRTYNNDDSIRELLISLNGVWENVGKGLQVLHHNNRPDDGILELVRDVGLEIVDIPNEVFR